MAMAEGLDPGAVTDLLRRWSSGDRRSLESVLPLVYEELRNISRSYISKERPGHTLGVTGLVHEAFLRLEHPAEWRDRKHFFGITARLMRQVLVDYSRHHGARKRNPDHTLPQVQTASTPVALEADHVLLDECLNRLEAVDQRKAEIVELRFFGGLTIQEIAEAKDLSASMVKKELRLAKIWLYRQIRSMSGDGRVWRYRRHLFALPLSLTS